MIWMRAMLMELHGSRKGFDIVQGVVSRRVEMTED